MQVCLHEMGTFSSEAMCVKTFNEKSGHMLFIVNVSTL
jgi:hypothetical protein